MTYPHRAIFAPLAQLIRASGLHPECREFESLGEHIWPARFLYWLLLISEHCWIREAHKAGVTTRFKSLVHLVKQF